MVFLSTSWTSDSLSRFRIQPAASPRSVTIRQPIFSIRCFSSSRFSADYLRKNYPQLNNDDINMCCMECLNFTPQQIRILFNHSNNKSIYTKRNRLRNKLKLPHNISLNEFLQSIIYELQHPA